MKFSIISGKEFLQFYVKDKTITKRLSYLHVSEIAKEIHIICLESDKIIGDVGLQINPYNKEELWFKHITVDQKFRNKGIASILVQMVFEYCKYHNFALSMSSYDEDGIKYIKPLIAKNKSKFVSVKVIEQ